MSIRASAYQNKKMKGGKDFALQVSLTRADADSILANEKPAFAELKTALRDAIETGPRKSSK